MEQTDIIVDFNKYCSKCKNKDLNEKNEPCNTCLEHGTNVNSEKPFSFKDERDEN